MANDGPGGDAPNPGNGPMSSPSKLRGSTKKAKREEKTKKLGKSQALIEKLQREKVLIKSVAQAKAKLVIEDSKRKYALNRQVTGENCQLTL